MTNSLLLDNQIDPDHAQASAVDRDDAQPQLGWPGKRPRAGQHAGNNRDLRTHDLRRTRAAIGALQGGHALPGALAERFGAQLGMDLGGVRLHHGGAAGAAAEDLGAVAFTHGRDIAMSGAVDPQSEFGQHVLAHEIIHVAQNQRSGGAAMELAAHDELGPSSSAVEDEAEAGAAALLEDQPFAVASHSALPQISRRGREPAPKRGPRPPQPPPLPPFVAAPPKERYPNVFGDFKKRSREFAVVPDARISAELDRRANPKLKEGYSNAIAQVNALRVQSLQFQFQPTGIWSTVSEAVFPQNAIRDHWAQFWSENAYRGGTTFIDHIQQGIEMVRSVVHLLGDVAGALAGIVGLGAAIAGVIGAAPVAGILAGVSTILGAIKLLTDLIDTFLSYVQFAILVERARREKNPAERVRLAALIHKESNDMAQNLVSVGIQIGTMLVTAGVGSALANGRRGLLKNAVGELGDMLRPAFKPSKIAGELRALLVRQKAPAGVAARALFGRTIFDFEIKKGLVAIQRNKRGAGSRITKKKEIIPVMTAPQMNGAKLVVLKDGLRKQLKMDGTGVVAGVGGGQLQADVKAPRSSTKPEGGLTPPGAVRGSLAHVDAWPSLIDPFTAASEPLADAIARCERMYKLAEEQAGEPLATTVRNAFQATTTQADHTRFKGLELQSDAREGQQYAQFGLKKTEGARGAKTGADGKRGTISSEFNKVESEGNRLEAPKPSANPLEIMYAATIGRVGSWIADLQKAIMNGLGQWGLAAAGFSKEELDLAGIEQEMRDGEDKDKTAEQQGGEAAAAADTIQEQVFKLQTQKTQDEQYAIQGMVDAQRFIVALEQAQQLLAQAIEGSQRYIAAVTPVLRHELATEIDRQPIDDTYLAPATTSASEFTASLDASNIGDDARADGIGQLRTMKMLYPELDTAQARTAIDGAHGQYLGEFQKLATGARDGAAAIAGVLTQFIGSHDYAGAHHNAGELEKIIADFDRCAQQLADHVYSAINGILRGCAAHIKQAVTAAERTPEPEEPPGVK